MGKVQAWTAIWQTNRRKQLMVWQLETNAMSFSLEANKCKMTNRSKIENKYVHVSQLVKCMEFHFMHCCVVQQGILIAIGEKLIRIVYNYCVYYIQHASFFEGLWCSQHRQSRLMWSPTFIPLCRFDNTNRKTIFAE